MFACAFQLLQVFESTGGELGPDDFNEFALPYLLEIATTVKQRVAALGLEVPPMVCAV